MPTRQAADSASDWVERSDPKTGKTYYYNATTRTTSWTKPEGAGGAKSAPPVPASVARPGPIAASRAAPKAPPGTNKALISAVSAFGSAGKPKAAVANAADRFAKLRALKAKAAGGDGGDGGGSADAAPAAAAPVVAQITAKPIDLNTLAANLSMDIGNATIEEYAEANFNMNRKGTCVGGA